MKKKLNWFFLLFSTFVLLTGCGGSKQAPKEPAVIPINTAAPSSEPSPSATPQPSPEPTKKPVSHKGEKRSPLTGLWMDRETAEKRPYAIMLNNIKYANPQGGTSEASILYEALTEGGITRLMGIFETLDSVRIGSVRSARHYFVSIADEYDAIFVHFGQTKYALSKIAQLGVNNLSGLEGIGSTVFYRDNSVRRPHNAFTDGKGILKGTEIKKYRTEYRDGFEHYQFRKKDTAPKGGEPAAKISLAFSSYSSPWLEYNKEDKLYYRFQYGGPHVDKNTGDQLAFKNVIVQLVKEWNIDHNGYQTMDIENSSGEGYYLTDGRAEPITWKKNEASKKMHYYDKNGNQLVLNPGKTYIAVFPRDRKVTISAKK